MTNRCYVCGWSISDWEDAVHVSCHEAVVEEEVEKAKKSAYEEGYRAGVEDTIAELETELMKLDLCPRCRELIRKLLDELYG